MNKPVPKVPEPRLDYHECAEYIAHKLGVKSIRDFAGKYSSKASDSTPYQDFWHLMCDSNEINNPCFVMMPYVGENPLDEYEGWQLKIIDAFNKEFGEEAEYWVEW